MMNYSYVVRQVKAAAAALEAFEAAYMGIIEDSATVPTTEARERASEMFYMAYDAAMDSSNALNKCKKGFEIGELYTMASGGDKAVIQRILEKYRV